LVILLANLHLGLVALADPVFMVPFVRDEKFVGREDILCQIEERLQTQRRVSLAGIGGVGYDLLYLFSFFYYVLFYTLKS
jgi:hypothetical protein